MGGASRPRPGPSNAGIPVMRRTPNAARLIAGLLLMILGSLPFLIPTSLEEPANPCLAPNPASSPWYHVDFLEIMAMIPPPLFLVLPVGVLVLGVGLIVWAFLEND